MACQDAPRMAIFDFSLHPRKAFVVGMIEDTISWNVSQNFSWVSAALVAPVTTHTVQNSFGEMIKQKSSLGARSKEKIPKSIRKLPTAVLQKILNPTEI